MLGMGSFASRMDAGDEFCVELLRGAGFFEMREEKTPQAAAAYVTGQIFFIKAGSKCIAKFLGRAVIPGIAIAQVDPGMRKGRPFGFGASGIKKLRSEIGEGVLQRLDVRTVGGADRSRRFLQRKSTARVVKKMGDLLGRVRHLKLAHIESVDARQVKAAAFLQFFQQGAMALLGRSFTLQQMA